jgi:hypothetical protein
MSKTNEYYRMLQEEEEINSLIDEKIKEPLTKEQKKDLKEYKKVLSTLLYSKKNHGAKGNA